MRLFAGSFGALVAIAAPAAALQDTNGSALVDGLRTCRAEPDAARLACFDRAVASLLAAEEKRQIRIVDRATVVRTKRSLFGFTSVTGDLFGDRRGSDKPSDESDVKEVTAAITQARSEANGLWVFAIQGGGVWQTTVASLSFEPRVGNQATIKAGILGRYTVRIRNGRTVDVRRLR